MIQNCDGRKFQYVSTNEDFLLCKYTEEEAHALTAPLFGKGLHGIECGVHWLAPYQVFSIRDLLMNSDGFDEDSRELVQPCSLSFSLFVLLLSCVSVTESIWAGAGLWGAKTRQSHIPCNFGNYPQVCSHTLSKNGSIWRGILNLARVICLGFFRWCMWGLWLLAAAV